MLVWGYHLVSIIILLVNHIYSDIVHGIKKITKWSILHMKIVIWYLHFAGMPSLFCNVNFVINYFRLTQNTLGKVRHGQGLSWQVMAIFGLFGGIGLVWRFPLLFFLSDCCSSQLFPSSVSCVSSLYRNTKQSRKCCIGRHFYFSFFFYLLTDVSEMKLFLFFLKWSTFRSYSAFLQSKILEQVTMFKITFLIVEIPC